MRLFHETQFASEKVIQRHELGIALDEFIYSPLRRQTNVKRKAVRAPSPTLHGTHDSVGAAGDQHEALFDHFACKICRHFVIG